MAWVRYGCVALILLVTVQAQVTSSFNDWTASGVEKEIEVMYRSVTKAKDDSTDMIENALSLKTNVTNIYFATMKDIYYTTNNELNAAADLAKNAGFPKCAAKARLDAAAIVAKQQANVHSNKDVFIFAAIKFESLAAIARSRFALYNLNVENGLLRGCVTPLNRIIPNGVVNCYKTRLQTFTRKLNTDNTNFQSIYKDNEVFQKAYLDFNTNNNRLFTQAKTDTAVAVAEALKCANLNKKSPVEVTLEQVAEVNATTFDYLNRQVNWLSLSCNGLKSKLNLAKNFTANDLQAGVQPFLSIGKFFKPFGLTVQNEVDLNNKINADVEKSTLKITTLLSDKTAKLNNFLNFINSINAKYDVDLSYVSEANLTNICVPKNEVEKISKEEEIKSCLANLFLKFSNSAQSAKDVIAQQIKDYDLLETEVVTTLRNNITTETNDAVEKIKLNLTALLTSYGYNPEMIIQIIDNYFSLPESQTIVENQLNIKANLGKIKLSCDSVKQNLDYDVDTATDQLSETIELIKVLNKKYNLTSLNTALIKYKTDLKKNITGFINAKYNNALNLAAPSLNYNLDFEVKTLLKNLTKCLPANLQKIISCVEPFTTKFNNTLTKTNSQTEYTLIDTNNFVEKLPGEIKESLATVFNNAKQQIKTLSTDAFNKANPGLDFRKDAVVAFQSENENKIKSVVQTRIENLYEFQLKNQVLLDKYKLDLENLFRPLRLAYEKSYSQIPNQPIPLSVKKAEIDNYISKATLNFQNIVDSFFKTDAFPIFQGAKNSTINDLYSYANELFNSDCNRFINIKFFYDNCTQAISKKYKDSLNKAGIEIIDTTQTIQSLSPKGEVFTEKIKERELNLTKNYIKQDMEKLEQNTKELLTNPTFLKDTLQNAWKEYDQAKLFTDLIKNSFNSSSINIPFLQFQNILKLSADPIKPILFSTVGSNEVTPSPELQILQNYGVNLNLLLENSPSSYKDKVVSNVQAVFENGNNIIEALRNQIVTDNAVTQNKIDSFINFIKEEKEKFTENAANENCKTVSAILYKICIKSYFDGLVNKLKSQKLQIEPIINTFNSVKFEVDLKNLNQQIKTELMKVDEKLKSEIAKVKVDTDLWNSKAQVIKNALEMINSSIAVNVVPTSNKVVAMITEQSNINNIPDIFRINISNVLAGNGSLNEDQKKVIEASVVKVSSVVQFYNNLNKIKQNLANSLQNGVNTLLTTVTDAKLKAKCQKDSNLEAFKACVEQNVNTFNTDINQLITDFNSVGQQSQNISKCAEKDIEKVVSIELEKAKESVTKENNDSNNSSSSNQIINDCLQGINKRINKEIVLKANEIFQITDEVAKPREFVSSIDDVLSTWMTTLDFAIKLNPKNVAKLNLEKQRLNNYRSETLNRVINIINLNMDEANNIISKTNNVLIGLKTINSNSLNQSCSTVYSSKSQFQQCVKQQCINLNNDIDVALKELINLSNNASKLKLEFETNITTTINNEVKLSEETAKKESERIIQEYNVTSAQIITVALGDFSKYNITPYTQSIQNLIVKANQLQAYAVSTNKTAENSLNRVNILLNLHVSAISFVCPGRSTKNETDYGQLVIREAKNKLYPVFPDTTAYTLGQLRLADQLNVTLRKQLDELIALEKNCNSSDRYKLLACVKKSSQAFGDYLNNATVQIKILASELNEESINRTIKINNWINIDVANEYEEIRAKLKPIPEKAYVDCNVTKERLLDFAKVNMDNRKNRFNTSVPNTVQSIIATANDILGMNYTGIVNLNESLQESVNFTRIAISDVLKSSNSSQITTSVRNEPNRLIGVGINQSDQYVIDLYATARNSILLAQSLQIEFDTLNRNTNKSAVEAVCFNTSSDYPMSDFVVCNNNYNYQYDVKLQNIQKQLNATLATLENIKNNGRQLILDNANKVEAEMKVQSAQYAIFLYFSAGMEIPSYLKIYVKDGCLVRVNGDPRNPCIVFS